MGTVTNTGNWGQGWSCCYTRSCGSWVFGTGFQEECIEMQTREVLKCYKHFCGSFQWRCINPDAYSNVEHSKDFAHEAWEGNKDSISWSRGHSCYIMKKHLSMFWKCSKNLSEAKFKSNRLTYLAEEISRQHSIQAVAQLLLIAFSQVYRETEQKVEQKNMWFG